MGFILCIRRETVTQEVAQPNFSQLRRGSKNLICKLLKPGQKARIFCTKRSLSTPEKTTSKQL